MKRITREEYFTLRKAGIATVRQRRKDFRPAMTVTRTKRTFWMSDC